MVLERATDDAEREAATALTERSSRRDLKLGLQGGLIATAVMTAFRIPITRSLPPTADFWAKYVGSGDPDEYAAQGLLLHLAYGAMGGVGFVAVFPTGRSGSEVSKERQGALRGALYGLLLSVFGVQVILKRLLEMDLSPDERWIFHVGHLIYGLTLGSWMGSKAA